MVITRQSTSLEKMLQAFPLASEKSNGWYSNPDNPTFDFRIQESGYVSIHSWTGRTREQILAMGGLTENDIRGNGSRSVQMRDALDLMELSQAKMIPWQFLFSLGLSDGYRYHGYSYVRIPYHLADGTEHTKIKVRKAVSGEYKHCWDEGTPGEILPYGLHKLDMARSHGYLIIGEGESDGWTFWYHGIPYLGVPGASHAKCLAHADMKDIAHVYILSEPDQTKKLQTTGEGFYKSVYTKLRQLGYKGAISCLPFEQITACKDPSDLHLQLKAWLPENKQGYMQMIANALVESIPSGDELQKALSFYQICVSDVSYDELCAFTADDAGNGDAMYALYGTFALWCATRGWFTYNGKNWEIDTDGALVKQCAVETLRRRRHAAVDKQKEEIIKCTKADDKRVNGCINRFKTLVNIAIEEFDNNPNVLNCKNGVLDLRTGELTQHNYMQRFTYCLSINYVERKTCTDWLTYLHDVIGGGQEVIDYLQEAVGYSLTGHTNEEILFYLYGPTRSGKGTFAETFLRLMPHPISTMVDFNSFTAKREGDTSNFDLAPLKPCRMVFASESNRSQSLNPAKIKQLTGGDSVMACFKHKDHFTYRPQFKMWLLSNHSVNGDPEDDALWGRVRVIQFPNSFLGKEDKTKKSRMREMSVLEGVLSWAVEGAIKWYARDASGLPIPQVIAKATQEHRDELDYVQQWLDECGESEEDAWTSNENVTTSYLGWCKNNNVQYTKGPKSLAQSLKTKGFRPSEQKKMLGENKRGVGGLRIM